MSSGSGLESPLIREQLSVSSMGGSGEGSGGGGAAGAPPARPPTWPPLHEGRPSLGAASANGGMARRSGAGMLQRSKAIDRRPRVVTSSSMADRFFGFHAKATAHERKTMPRGVVHPNSKWYQARQGQGKLAAVHGGPALVDVTSCSND